jgi:hypothetical protein
VAEVPGRSFFLGGGGSAGVGDGTGSGFGSTAAATGFFTGAVGRFLRVWANALATTSTMTIPIAAVLWAGECIYIPSKNGSPFYQIKSGTAYLVGCIEFVEWFVRYSNFTDTIFETPASCIVTP